MKIVFLGTNGWFDSHGNSTISTFIETKDTYLILDAGYGIAKAIKYIKKDKPVYVFLSHLHLDHVVGLHTLPLLNGKKLTIFVPQGMKKYYRILVNRPFTGLGGKHNVQELKPGKYKIGVEFECLFLKHVVPTLGFRFFLENKIVTYCCDTAVCKNDLLLSKNADILIHECSSLSGHDGHWGHSSPEDVGVLAKKAKVKKLVLTHFSPTSYLISKNRKWAEKMAGKHFKNVVSAEDDMLVRF